MSIKLIDYTHYIEYYIKYSVKDMQNKITVLILLQKNYIYLLFITINKNPKKTKIFSQFLFSVLFITSAHQPLVADRINRGGGF